MPNIALNPEEAYETPMTDEATRKVRQVWEDQADAWYTQRESLLTATRPVHDWLVDHVDPKPGDRVLEIAAGPGDTGFLAAARLTTGELVSTDIAPSMVRVARQRGAELGIVNATYQVADAQAMEFADESFDGIICRWGFMLMPDPAAALRECRRVLKPGGRLALAVFTGPEENGWASIPVRVLRDAGHLAQPGAEWQPGILALADRTRLEKLIEGAGFAEATIERVNMSWTFANTGEYWTFLLEVTALGPALRALSGTERDDVRAAIDARLATFIHKDALVLPAQSWGALTIR
jgi:ubiquinone/menaquinone biosynthesis C-methylase UbiE